jgi:hypothetical protein
VSVTADKTLATLVLAGSLSRKGMWRGYSRGHGDAPKHTRNPDASTVDLYLTRVYNTYAYTTIR